MLLFITPFIFISCNILKFQFCTKLLIILLVLKYNVAPCVKPLLLLLVTLITSEILSIHALKLSSFNLYFASLLNKSIKYYIHNSCFF